MASNPQWKKYTGPVYQQSKVYDFKIRKSHKFDLAETEM